MAIDKLRISDTVFFTNFNKEKMLQEHYIFKEQPYLTKYLMHVYPITYI